MLLQRDRKLKYLLILNILFSPTLNYLRINNEDRKLLLIYDVRHR